MTMNEYMKNKSYSCPEDLKGQNSVSDRIMRGSNEIGDRFSQLEP